MMCPTILYNEKSKQKYSNEILDIGGRMIGRIECSGTVELNFRNQIIQTKRHGSLTRMYYQQMIHRSFCLSLICDLILT